MRELYHTSKAFEIHPDVRVAFDLPDSQIGQLLRVHGGAEEPAEASDTGLEPQFSAKEAWIENAASTAQGERSTQVA